MDSTPLIGTFKKYNLKTAILFYFITILFSLASVDSFGQKSYKLKLYYNTISKKKPTIKINTKAADSLKIINQLTKITTTIRSIGYVEANLDSLVFTNKEAKAYFNPGTLYQWQELKPGNTDWKDIPNIDFRFINFKNRNFNYNQLINLEESVIVALENTGYPFAWVQLADINIINNRITATLNIYKEQLVTIDTIILKGYKDISTQYIEHATGIRIGEPYNEQAIQQIDKQLSKLSFARLGKASGVIFHGNKATIVINLRKKSSNRFDGIIGFQPSTITGQALSITGDLNLKLNNILKSGELIQLRWESPGNKSQSLKLKLVYPYIFNSAFGLGGDFSLDKRDSLFLNIEGTPSIIFSKNASATLSLYGHFFSSKSLITNPKNKPTNVSSSAIGLALNINQLDYPFNPRKGYLIHINSDIGNSSSNSAISTDSLKTSSYRFRFQSKASIYFAFGQRSTLKFANASAFIKNPNLYQSELYRIGGFSTLRGFDEQSLFADFYSIFTLEYHYLLNRNSYLGAFYDIAPLTNSINRGIGGNYQSFGFNFSFATKAGIFNLAYALGKYPYTGIQFRTAKIHFGYTSLF